MLEYSLVLLFVSWMDSVTLAHKAQIELRRANSDLSYDNGAHLRPFDFSQGFELLETHWLSSQGLFPASASSPASELDNPPWGSS